jgi:Phage endonuclease I
LPKSKPNKATKDKVTGMRGGFEPLVKASIESVEGVVCEYEAEKLKYTIPEKNYNYNPDFKVTTPSGASFFVEAKGYFKARDIVKMLLVKKANPDADIRMVFQNNGKYSKTMRYSDWCDKHGFPWSIKIVPPEWLV